MPCVREKKNSGLRCIAQNFFQHKHQQVCSWNPCFFSHTHSTLCHVYAKKNSGLRCIAHNVFQHKHGTLCHVYAKKIMDDGGGGKRQGVGCNEGGRWDAVKVGG